MAQTELIQTIKKEISHVSRILTSGHELDWQDRDAAAKSLGYALERLDLLELESLPETEEVFAV